VDRVRADEELDLRAVADSQPGGVQVADLGIASTVRCDNGDWSSSTMAINVRVRDDLTGGNEVAFVH
jgi:hypothetical protein